MATDGSGDDRSRLEDVAGEAEAAGDGAPSGGGREATVRRLTDGTTFITPPLRDSPPTIEAVERRRAHLWIVAALLLLASSAAVLLVLVGGDLDELLEVAPALRWSMFALSIAFILYVIDQERRLRRLTAALIEERVLTSSLSARIRDLAALTRVGRVVNSVLTLSEVLETILDALFELTGAVSGSVMLRDGDDLRIAASVGEHPAPIGETIRLGSGVAGWVAANREPILINGRLVSDQFPGRGERSEDTEPGSSVVAPLVTGDEVVGVLAVERSPDSEEFREGELRSVAVFAEQAATAVRNARRYEEERASVERLADVLEQRAEFVATLVHELRTPVTVILGFISVLESSWDDLDEQRRIDVLASVRSQGERMRTMVDEILRTASVEAGAELRRDRVELGTLLTDLADHIGTIAAAQEGARRDITVSGATEAHVPGDEDALSRIFENLLNNAVKYSPPGSSVEIVVRDDEDEVQVDVVDHGPGISDDELESIFERFRRGGPGVAGGVGLGLYIVRTLVASHGGRVWATRNEEDGSTFSVRLPKRSSLEDPHRYAGDPVARPGT